MARGAAATVLGRGAIFSTSSRVPRYRDLDEGLLRRRKSGGFPGGRRCRDVAAVHAGVGENETARSTCSLVREEVKARSAWLAQVPQPLAARGSPGPERPWHRHATGPGLATNGLRYFGGK
jgi:hypothetical protein